MKTLINVLFVVALSLSSGCGESPEPNDGEEQKRPRKEIQSTYPFSEATKIEILSYPDRLSWDTTPSKGGFTLNELVARGELVVNPDSIKERITLDKTQSESIFELLINSTCEDSSSAACFEPRHALIFYNGKKVIAYLELCFSCHSYETSGNFEVNHFCFSSLRTEFEKIGIGYY